MKGRPDMKWIAVLCVLALAALELDACGRRGRGCNGHNGNGNGHACVTYCQPCPPPCNVVYVIVREAPDLGPLKEFKPMPKQLPVLPPGTDEFVSVAVEPYRPPPDLMADLAVLVAVENKR
jgi:hypothetical protein